MASKNYKVILEYIKIKLILEKFDLLNRNIIVNSMSEHIIINIQRLEYNMENYINTELPNLIINKQAITFDDIMDYWNKNLIAIETNFKKKSLKINQDYFIVPCYIINDIIILGIIIFDNKNMLLIENNNCNNNNNNDINYKILETYNYLSTIKIHNLKKINQNELNIINGILNYRITNGNDQIKLLSKNILKDKHLKICIKSNNNFKNNFENNKGNKGNELLIKWEYIFRNIENYIPKFKIIYKIKINAVTNFFQNRLNL